MYTVAVMLYAPVCASNFVYYSGQEGHSSIYGSRMCIPAIDQSTVNGLTFQTLTGADPEGGLGGQNPPSVSVIILHAVNEQGPSS